MQDSQQTATEVRATQEVRFAVVMYGGLSLAIYMNGVAQEMLRLVRATAPAKRDKSDGKSEARGDLKGSEVVYRRLGQMLRRGDETLALPRDAARPGENEVKPSTPISTRFIVDVISGTSAGGINGVFLAKALANDQDIDELKGLWVEEGDFGSLMNDRRKLPGLAPRTQSILDGRHMYAELLKALEGMEAANDSADTPGEPKTDSPLVEELDLFVTTTDISGLTLKLQLADGVVKERRHRNVFHFAYNTTEASGEKEGRNHFGRRFNPFLAFAARCTSAFPVAFEPMRLGDIDDVLSSVEPYSRMSGDELKPLTSGSDEWRVFFGDYLKARGEGAGEVDEDKAAEEFALRSFADGGVLDNKPFSYATDALLRRRADLPVDRKLVFVDPDPQNPDRRPDFSRDVDVLENTLSAISPAVSTETIREDIQRILERNRLIERIGHVTRGIERDVRVWESAHPRPKQPSAAQAGQVWAEQDLSEMIQEKGIAYGGYYRLKVGVLTDELANYVAQAANFDAKSDHFVAVRDLVRAWRDMTYVTYKPPRPPRVLTLNMTYVAYKSEDASAAGGARTLNRLLLNFDLGYRLRRLNFLRTRINELSYYNPEQLYDRLLGGESYELEATGEQKRRFHADFHEEIRDVQCRLSEIYRELLRVQRKFRKRGEENPLHAAVGRTGITQGMLDELLKVTDTGERLERAREILKDKQEAIRLKFDEVADKLSADIGEATRKASDDSLAVLNLDDPTVKTEAARTTRELLQHYYTHFEDYDMVAFPIMYQTEVGETVKVDIIRVSPYDSTALIDETEEDRKDAEGKRGRHKLGGTAFGHFGAFLKKEWRTNDILWGRLDAAERIIRTLLPDSPDRATLIREAQTAILEEELLEERRRDEVRRLVARSLLAAGGGGRRRDALEVVRAQLEASPPADGTVRSFFESCVKPDQLWDYFRNEGGYEVDRGLDPQAAVQLLARITKVTGRMLETLAEKHRVESKRVAWVTRLGQVFWSLVEVAVPGSFWNLVVRHWLTLLYLFSALLIVGGALSGFREVQHFGMVALAAVASAHLVIKLLGDFMRGRSFRLLRFVGVFVLVLLAVPLVTSMILGLDELLRLPAVQALRGSWPLRWFPPREGESAEWHALRLIGVTAGLVALLAVLVGSLLPPARAFYRKVRALFLKVKALLRIVLAYAEKRVGEMDKAARPTDGK